VHVQRGPIVQYSELMLSTTIDTGDATTSQTTQPGLAEMASNVWMKDSRASNALA
jgi:hypothetical protein